MLSPRVALAAALFAEPDLLLLDEPTAGMGPEERWKMIDTVHRLWSLGGLTLIFIEHDMDLVFRFAARITVLVGGRILTEGTPAEIAADPRVKEVYLGEAQHG